MKERVRAEVKNSRASFPMMEREIQKLLNYLIEKVCGHSMRTMPAAMMSGKTRPGLT